MSEIVRTTNTTRALRVTTTAVPSTDDADRDALTVFRVSCDNPRLPTQTKPAPEPPLSHHNTPYMHRCTNCHNEKPIAAFPFVSAARGVRSWWCNACEAKRV